MSEFDNLANKKKEEKERKKRVLLVSMGFCVVAIIVLAFLIMYIQDKDEKTFKLFINDQQANFNQGFYITDEESGEIYLNAKDLANYIGWSYQNGEYGSFTEDTNSGYINNDYEVASFVSDSNILKKYIEVTATEYTNEAGEKVSPYTTFSENGTLETTTLSLPIIKVNEQIYFPLKHINDICNCSFNFDNPYRMYIYNQEYLINLAQTNAYQMGYESISGVYENMRALSYGMMVVKKDNYGLVDLYRGTSIIGTKYTDMIFAQNVKEFFVKTNTKDTETIGILDIEGKTIVSPKNYSNIQVLSDDLGLYLVEKNDEYGVINRKGDVIVHCEYESVGLTEDLLQEFNFSVDDNKYLLFNNTVVVEKDGKFGLYNLEGEQTLKCSYVGLGYMVESDKNAVKNSESVLTIKIDDLKLSNGKTRDVQAIIIQQEIDDEVKYGVYDVESKKLILPCMYDRIYSITSKGSTDYYIEFQGQTAKFSDQLAQYPEIFD